MRFDGLEEVGESLRAAAKRYCNQVFFSLKRVPVLWLWNALHSFGRVALRLEKLSREFLDSSKEPDCWQQEHVQRRC